MIELTERAREAFEAERWRQGKPALGIQVNFVYGCGGAGFRIVFTEAPEGSHRLARDSVSIAVDAESAERLAGAIVDWEGPPDPGFVLRHPDATLVEFC